MKNARIEHLEDLLLAGPVSATLPLTILSAVGDSLRNGDISALDISTKWDGSPAIVFGPDPADGRFFVSTKAAFNKVARVAKTHEDINTLFIEPIRPYLHAALSELSALHPGIVLQGDVLFVNDPEHRLAGSNQLNGQLTDHTIDGYLTFKPNTILYAVDPDSTPGRAIASAGLGIALHTQYVSTGDTLAQCQALPLSPDTFAALRQTPHVFIVDSHYDDLSGSVVFTEEEAADFDLALDAAREAVELPDQIYTIVSAEPMQTELRKYINQGIRLGTLGILDGPRRLESFWLYLNKRKAYEVAQRVTARGQDSVGAKFNVMLEDLTLPKVREGMIRWFDLHRALTRAKTIVIRKLEQAPSEFRTFVLSDDGGGWQPTGPEGFVVANGAQVVKLVDRPEFSHRNFKGPREAK
jgi:hypothetical protein